MSLTIEIAQKDTITKTTTTECTGPAALLAQQEVARIAGGGASHPTNPEDPGFSRLGIFGGTLTSTVQAGFGGGTVPGGWPNGRRFGDDVVDIAVTALILRPI